MESLVAGIFQCPQCRKIIKQKEEKIEEEEKEIIKEGEFRDGEYFHKELSLNKKYEVCKKGIVINKTSNRVFAVLICEGSYKEKYVRVSWWKNYQHAGMFKIYDRDVLSNTIKTLEKIDESFDDLWSWSGNYGRSEPKTEQDLEKEKKIEIIKARIIENRTCPNCQKKMDPINSDCAAFLRGHTPVKRQRYERLSRLRISAILARLFRLATAYHQIEW